MPTTASTISDEARQRLRAAMDAQDITCEALAHKLGVTHQHVSATLRGTKPLSTSTIERFAKALGVKISLA